MARAERLRAAFRARFGGEPALYRAPGRVNLIGEHTDYNGGYVLPAAIDVSTRVAVRARADGLVRVHSLNLDAGDEFPLASLDGPVAAGPAGWSRYVAGVARALRADGVPLAGAELVIDGDVPLGAGLSSSAALEVAVGLALLGAAGAARAAPALALLCQRAENEYVGMRCGIMDQFVSACGRAGHALLLDCRSLDYRLLPLDVHAAGRAAPRLVICNSLVRHAHASGEYNRRRAECEAGVAHLARAARVESLRDLTAADLERAASGMDPVVLRRCRHVVSENARVLAAADALEAADFAAFGGLMAASHASLRDDYEVSCPELDLLVRLAAAAPGVFGARMTGGGFGGCTINLVAPGDVAAFVAQVGDGYARVTGRAPEFHVCTSADGGGPEGTS
jgi:galactokinase